ncbi:MAG: hypothetical protein WCI43_02930 [Candidatus Firestonebacteria bacterium]
MAENKGKRCGVIDIGTNSLKLLIAESDGKETKNIERLKNVIPIGKDVFFTERISQETTKIAIAILEKYKNKLSEYGIEDIKIIATTAVREAINKDVFIDTIYRKTGLKIEVLTAGDVVYYIDAFLYHTLKDKYPIHDKNLLIAELGSGSLDVSILEKGYTLMTLGLPLGPLKLKQFSSALEGSYNEINYALEEYIENEISYIRRNLPSDLKIDDIILIDENYASYLNSITAKASLEPDFMRISKPDASEIVNVLSERTARDISTEFKIPSETAETITSYAMTLNSLFSLANSEYIYVLKASLSEAIIAGILLDYEVSPKYNKTNQLLSMTTFICKKHNLDLKHIKQVSWLSEILFAGLREQLGLKKPELLFLLLAAQLHDTGMIVSNRAHHKHSEYLISSLNLFRLSEEDIKIIACIARYHRKAHPLKTHLLYRSLPSEKQILVQKLSALLRIANALDGSHKQKVAKLELVYNKTQELILALEVKDSFTLERADFLDKKELLEEISGLLVSLKIKGV